MHWINSQQGDEFIWTPSRNGCFLVKPAFSLLTHSMGSALGSPSLWNKLWCSRLYERLKFLLWKILIGALPKRKLLASCFRVDTSLCPFCLLYDEDALHLFFFFPFARPSWFSLPWTVWWDCLSASSSIPVHGAPAGL